MFARAASWVELGIMPDEDDKRTKTFAKGQKFLIPEEQKLKNLPFSSSVIRPITRAVKYRLDL